MERLTSRAWKGRAVNVAWGFVDQTFSSGSNFALSLVAGRVLGPVGLGVVFVAFSSYTAVLGLQRSLLTEPLVAASATLTPQARLRVARFGLSLVIVGALVSTALVVVGGVAISGRLGRGLLLLAPWLLPLLVQDFWRTILFRDERGRAAAVNDGTWVAAMGVTVPFAWASGSEWAVIASWAAAASVAAALGFVQTRILPAPLGASLKWWRSEAWPLGRWLGANNLVSSLAAYATIVVLAGLLGTRRLGGLRAVDTIFAPLTLIAPAVNLPGLPAVARALATSLHSARRVALLLSIAATVVTAAYLVVVDFFGGRRLLTLVYGDSFKGFSNLIWPVGSGQLAIAFALGFGLLLTAQRRGRAVLLRGTISSAFALAVAAGLAWAYGLKGAAWSISAGSAFAALSTLAVALSPGRDARSRSR